MSKLSHNLDREIEQTQADLAYWREQLIGNYATSHTKQRVKELVKTLKERLRKLKQEKASEPNE